jgi:hypothetical protein
MKKATTLDYAISFLLWLPLIFFSFLLSHNAILYFTHGGEYGILPEKTGARQDMLWNIAFYTHLPAGIVCLLSPMLLFARNYFRWIKDLHATVGRTYLWTTLVLVCPTGMYLALYAKGGLATQAGFMIQGILLFWFTWMGYRKVREGNQQEHVMYMIRSYAIAAVVLTFRIFHILFFLWKVPYQDNYAISQWLGLTGNMLLAELAVVYYQRRRFRKLKIIQL